MITYNDKIPAVFDQDQAERFGPFSLEFMPQVNFLAVVLISGLDWDEEIEEWYVASEILSVRFCLN